MVINLRITMNLLLSNNVDHIYDVPLSDSVSQIQRAIIFFACFE